MSRWLARSDEVHSQHKRNCLKSECNPSPMSIKGYSQGISSKLGGEDEVCRAHISRVLRINFLLLSSSIETLQ